jgi:FlaA1/EpsC-like NDP-sugar epimerase
MHNTKGLIRIFEGKSVLVIGGTGSLGKTLIRRILTGEMGRPKQITVLSRDEAKQHYMRLDYLHRRVATDEIMYQNFRDLLQFRIGDVRDYATVLQSVRDVDIVIQAAALKQVPSCEYFPFEAVKTNILGAQNLARAVMEDSNSVETVVGISTDKACKPINVMGMTKAIMERIFVEANLHSTRSRFVCVRYGNVIASRGSVVPLFLDQIATGGPVTVTTRDMTRFLLSLDEAAETVFAAIRSALPGETYIPRVKAARIVDVAEVLINGRNIEMKFVGIRPGEKTHEIMVSEEEIYRTIERGGYYVICPLISELGSRPPEKQVLNGEYSSAEANLNRESLKQLLAPYLGEPIEQGILA